MNKERKLKQILADLMTPDFFIRNNSTNFVFEAIAYKSTGSMPLLFWDEVEKESLEVCIERIFDRFDLFLNILGKRLEDYE